MVVSELLWLLEDNVALSELDEHELTRLKSQLLCSAYKGWGWMLDARVRLPRCP